jgi:hypothetical protein
MTTVMRHGADSHYLRPDAVYRTSVIQPLIGYSPQQDVMNVAAEFTQGPYAFQQGTGLGLARRGSPIRLMGPGYHGPIADWWTRVKAKWAMLKAQYQAQKAMRAAAKAGMHGLGFTPFGPAAWAGPQVVGDPSARMGMLVAMAQKDLPADFQAMNASLIYQRWMALRMPTR